MPDVLHLSNAIATPAAYDDATQTQLGAIYTSDGRLVESAQRLSMGAWKHGDKPHFDTTTRIDVRLKSAVYGGRYYGHFGHFLLESVPALYQAAALGGDILCHPNPTYWRFAVPNRRWWQVLSGARTPARSDWIEAHYRRYLLEALEIAPKRIHLVSAPTRIKTLIVPPLDQPPISGVIGPNYVAACAKIRAHALAGGAASAERVYLSRRHFVGGSDRRLENEAEVEAALAKHGFTAVIPEDLPMEEQIRIVASARFVAGVDGSALHLCGFMRQGGKVLIIETRPFRTQRAINEALDLATLSAPAALVGKDGGVDVYRADLAAIDRSLQT